MIKTYCPPHLRLPSLTANATHPEEAERGAHSSQDAKCNTGRTAPPLGVAPSEKKSLPSPAPSACPSAPFPPPTCSPAGAPLGLRGFPFAKGSAELIILAALPAAPAVSTGALSSAALADTREGDGREGERGRRRECAAPAPPNPRASGRASERAGEQHLLSRRAGISPTLARRPPRCPSRKLRILPRAARLSSAASSLFALSCGRRRRCCCRRCPSVCVPPPQGGVTCREKKNWKGRKRSTYACV